MARETYTSISFYVSLTIREFFYWRDNIIAAMKEDEKKQERR